MTVRNFFALILVVTMIYIPVTQTFVTCVSSLILVVMCYGRISDFGFLPDARTVTTGILVLLLYLQR
jgi:hypothetical protein